MSLNIVPEAAQVPGYCAASGSTTGPFVATGRVLRAGGHVYLSVAYLHSIATDVGLVPASELVGALKEMDALTTRVQALEAELNADTAERVACALELAAADVRALGESTED